MYESMSCINASTQLLRGMDSEEWNWKGFSLTFWGVFLTIFTVSTTYLYIKNLNISLYIIEHTCMIYPHHPKWALGIM